MGPRASSAPLLLAIASIAPACDKREPPWSDAPRPAPSAAVAPAAPESGVWRCTVDPHGIASVDMPGLKEDIRGEASAARGTFDVVFDDLARSRGEIDFDLSTFSTHTFHSDKDALQTKHAQTWLEVKVGDTQNEAMRWATFAIRSVEAPSVASVAAAPVTHDGGDDVRTVTMKVRGDLRLHGRSLPQEAVVDVAFRVPAGSPATARPRRVEVRSREPMHIVLKDYDVRPRDPAGQLVAWTTQLVSKVAETADVTVNLGASPAP